MSWQRVSRYAPVAYAPQKILDEPGSQGQCNGTQEKTLTKTIMWHKLSPALAIVLGFSAHQAFAAPPSGNYTYSFDTQSVPLWDVSGSYHISPSINGDVPVDFDISVLQDNTGKLYGSGPTSVDIGGQIVPGNYIVKGKIFSSAGVTRATATVKVTGTGLISGLIRPYSLSESFILEIDSSGLAVIGTGKGSATAKGIGTGKIAEDINDSLPEGMDGGWQLDLGVQTNVKKLSGNSSVSLSNGRSFDFVTSGSYSPTTDFSKVKLTGSGTSASAKLSLVASGEGMGLDQITGKLLGQTIKY